MASIKRTSPGVADIFRQYGEAFRSNNPLSKTQIRAMRAIEICRTPDIGGRAEEEKCDHCGTTRILFNSCRNRHCPRCQFERTRKWLAARKREILPIQYFHVVFTIPSQLNWITLLNQQKMYDLLFKSVAETLLELGADAKYLGATVGISAILHTWGQNLMYHPHIHTVVTGGGLAADKKQWLSTRTNYFIPVKVMSARFRDKFLDYLEILFQDNELQLNGELEDLKKPKYFYNLIRSLRYKKWVVYAKPPFARPENVIEYLGKYTHKVAISNSRILALEDDKVTFLWRDYADENKQKQMELQTKEFMRRFLLHILPHRYVKIRHYGLLGNKGKQKLLACCRAILGEGPNIIAEKPETKEPESRQEMILRLTGIDILLCPYCKQGKMVKNGSRILARNRGP